MGAAPSGRPGWPLSAFCTMSTDRKRSVSMHCWSSMSAMAIPRFHLVSAGRVGRRRDRAVHDGLRVRQKLLKVIATGEALRVDFVDLFGAGGPGREPAALGDHLDAADRGTVARRLVEDAFNQLRNVDERRERRGCACNGADAGGHAVTRWRPKPPHDSVGSG